MSGPSGGPSVEEVYEVLDTVKDPCMGAAGLDLSIADLGLVYRVEVDDGAVNVEMTFTEIGCVFTHVIGSGVYDAVGALPGVESVELTPRWLPLWTEDRVNAKASKALSKNRSVMLQKIKRRSLSPTLEG
ncbi:MAG TPA: metal-sulfur cluster assembly factor [Rubrobacteraceae bacterium]|nr:metal-sulfur cluster assembly factor [Rubrobacteraceae bacterium]